MRGPLGAYSTKKISWAYHLPLWRYGPLKFVHALAYKAVSTRDLDMTLTSNAKVEDARPTRGLPNKKKIMGLSLTVMEIWAFEVWPCFSIQGCVGLPFTRHRREHVLEHVRISILPRLVCIWWARRGEPLRAKWVAEWVAEVSVARAGQSAELLGLSACCCHLLCMQRPLNTCAWPGCSL